MMQPSDSKGIFKNCAAKRIIIRSGNRGEKTAGLAYIAALQFLEGKRILYAAPT